MLNPLKIADRYLLLSFSTFVFICLGSVIFMRCTSKDTTPIIIEDQTKDVVSHQSASLLEGLKLNRDGKITIVSASSMLANFSVKSVKALVTGTSNLHDWESAITRVECNSSPQKDKNGTQELVIKIPVKGIKGKEGKKMDEKTYEAFKADKNPYITYSFSHVKVQIDNNKDVNLEADGQLSMAGSTKPVTMEGFGKQLDNGDLKLSVTRKIKMTDFNIEPPTMVLGTVRVGDEINVSFDLVLTRSENK